MTSVLTQQQRQFAQYVLMFDRFVSGQPLPYEMAQNELALAFQRATLGCAENQLEQTGITDDQFRPPFTAVVKTPSGLCEPMKRARLKLNNQQIAAISWPENPMTRVPVELQEHNLVEFEFDLPDFGGMEVVIRGNRR